jgi:hypothetical protein
MKLALSALEQLVIVSSWRVRALSVVPRCSRSWCGRRRTGEGSPRSGGTHRDGLLVELVPLLRVVLALSARAAVQLLRVPEVRSHHVRRSLRLGLRRRAAEIIVGLRDAGEGQ